MKVTKGFVPKIAAVLLTLLLGSIQFSHAESLSSGFVRYFDNGTNGTLNLSDGNTWILTYHNLDFNSYTGEFELKFGDRGPGSSWASFLCNIYTHDIGAGGHLLEVEDEDGSLESTHQLALGEGSNPVDIRFMLSQNVDDTWNVTPQLRLDGGSWTPFSGGSFQSTNSFDLTLSMMTLQFTGGGAGTMFYTPPTAVAGNVHPSPYIQTLTVANPTKTIDVEFAGGGSDLVYGYSVKFEWDPAVASTNKTLVSEGNLLSDQGSTLFFADSTGPSEVTVDCILLGAQPGVAGPGTMFSIDFTGLTCDTSAVDITILSVVDKDNVPVTGITEADGEIQVSLAAPIFTVNAPFPDTLCYSVAPVIDLSASVSCSDLDSAFFRVDGGGWFSDANLFSDFAGQAWSNATWTFPIFAVVSEGPHLIELRCFDDFGNVSATVAWNFIKDTINPDPVDDFNAVTGNGKVHLSWTNPATDFIHVEVRRKSWDATTPFGYPEYPGLALGYPISDSDGDLVYWGTGDSFTDSLTDRSAYFYRAFTYDCAENLAGGAPPIGALPDSFAQGDRATNYWLGDVSSSGGGYDGEVDFFDLNALSAGYRKYNPGSPPVPPHDELDVGPTHNASRLGIPVPDDNIDFPDLVIFAMNYNVVMASGKVGPTVALSEPAEGGNPMLELEVISEIDDIIEVRMSIRGNNQEVKAGSALLEFDSNSLEWMSTRSSDELVAADANVFLQSGELEEGQVWVDMAVLGTDRVLQGSGELATLRFRVSGDDRDIAFGKLDLRDADNGRLVAGGTDLAMGAGASVPRVTRLAGANPNPFNPTTSIQFEIGAQAHVSLRVYDVAGRLVNTLVNESKAPGTYTVVWDGKDADGQNSVSGVYFARMESGSYKSTTKMLMLK